MLPEMISEHHFYWACNFLHELCAYPFLCVEATALSGFGGLFGVSCAGGQRRLLRSGGSLAMAVCPGVTRSQHFLLSFGGPVRYTYVLTASAISTPFSAPLMGRGRVGDDL
jgi:hypothetical protein